MFFRMIHCTCTTDLLKGTFVYLIYLEVKKPFANGLTHELQRRQGNPQYLRHGLFQIFQISKMERYVS